MSKENLSNFYYKLALALKGLIGVLEIIGAAALYFANSVTLDNLWLKLLHEELLEDPRDFLANWVVNFFQSLSVELKYFLVVYLLVSGLIKLFLVGGLWFKKIWFYPVALLLLAAFIIYQLYHLSFHFSALILFFAIIDGFIMFMVWRDYQKVLPKKIC